MWDVAAYLKSAARDRICKHVEQSFWEMGIRGSQKEEVARKKDPSGNFLLCYHFNKNYSHSKSQEVFFSFISLVLHGYYIFNVTIF